jgi:hypothetical protein
MGAGDTPAWTVFFTAQCRAWIRDKRPSIAGENVLGVIAVAKGIQVIIDMSQNPRRGGFRQSDLH